MRLLPRTGDGLQRVMGVFYDCYVHIDASYSGLWIGFSWLRAMCFTPGWVQ